MEARWRDDDYTVDAAVVVQRAEDRDDLLDALAHMPAIYRTAVVLHDAEAMTSAEVAEVMGVGLAAAKQRIRRGRMMLVSSWPTRQRRSGRGVPMRCWQARSQVSDYLDGDLDPGRAAALEAHLAGCRHLPAAVRALVGTRRHWRSARTPTRLVPAELAARIEPAGLTGPAAASRAGRLPWAPCPIRNWPSAA